jgi:NADPH2 dehydrogenase
MRFPLETFAAMRAVWPADKPMGVRISVTDWMEGGWDVDQSVAFAKELKKLGCDYVDVSSGALDPRQQVPFAPGYNVPFAAKVKKEAGLPVMCVGLITTARECEDFVASGKTDFVVLARGMMWDPRFAWHAAEELGAEAPYAPKYMAAHPKMRPQIFPNRAQPA